VASQGFSVAVPESWRAIGVDEYREGDAESLIEENPALEPYAEAFRGPDSLLKFVAVGPNVADDALSLNIIVEELSRGMTLEKYNQVSVSFLRTLPNVSGDVESERVRLPAGEAVKLSYRAELMIEGSPQTVFNLTYLLVDDGTAYVLGYHTRPELASTYEDTFARSAQSFRLT
jgi:hypothetical protein